MGAKKNKEISDRIYSEIDDYLWRNRDSEFTKYELLEDFILDKKEEILEILLEVENARD